MAVKLLISNLIAVSGWLFLGAPQAGFCLPPPDEVPEEILRAEIITEARSPLDGLPLSAADYAALLDRLQDPNRVNLAPDSVRELIFLLQLRRVIKPVLPIIP